MIIILGSILSLEEYLYQKVEEKSFPRKNLLNTELSLFFVLLFLAPK